MTPEDGPSAPSGPDRLLGAVGRRIWIGLAAAAGVAVVVLSWRVPEPQTHPGPRQVENMSYLKHTPAQMPAPNYGAR